MLWLARCYEKIGGHELPRVGVLSEQLEAEVTAEGVLHDKVDELLRVAAMRLRNQPQPLPSEQTLKDLIRAHGEDLRDIVEWLRGSQAAPLPSPDVNR
jgi:hypothetical protein